MSSISCWLGTSLTRVYPATPASDKTHLDLLAARGERVSFQACIKNNSTRHAVVQIITTAPSDVDITVRRVGYVPVAHLSVEAEDEAEWEGVGHVPGYVPDPLFPEDTVIAGPFESHSFWITAKVPTGINPGVRNIGIKFMNGEETVCELKASIDVKEMTLQPVSDFPVTHWFYADAICDWYGLEPYEERFWPIVEKYMRDLVEHGGSCQYVPLFTPPTDGIKRPHQLIKITTPSEGRYEFNFSDVRRWIKLAQSCGAQYFEWTHFFSQWGVKNAIRIYRSNQDPESLLWPEETEATSDTYRNFLAQFLPEFYKFLEAEDLLDKSFFHVSDEPHADHLDNYRKARAVLKELAPWMKVSDALSNIEYARHGLTDIPIPVIATAKQFIEEGFPAWAYFCCGPRGKYINRLTDTPLQKIRMSGWLFYKLKAHGFLHWGYNYWYKRQTQQLIDPFTEQSGAAWPGWTYGDTFVVYPGPDGPIDSLRWEVWADSLQDYTLLQSAGIDPDSNMLSELKDYYDFPRDKEWFSKLREQIINK